MSSIRKLVQNTVIFKFKNSKVQILFLFVMQFNTQRVLQYYVS